MLNVASPAADISKLNAVIAEPPSSPINLISLSCVETLISKSVELFVNLPNSVPSSFKMISAPPASMITSVYESIVTPSDPSFTILSSEILPKFVIFVSPKFAVPVTVKSPATVILSAIVTSLVE